MQEMLEWVRATLPMDLDTPMLIEEKIQSLVKKEKEIMCQFQSNGQQTDFYVKYENNEDCFDKTFNTNEK